MSQFLKAERMREALKGKPESRRTLADYTKAIQAYRNVYYIAPTSARADESVLAVAELMAEQGRSLGGEKSFRDAIGQYEFLRKEYPGSRYRMEALFTIAQIYREDLNDKAKAKAVFEEVIRRYPGHELADQAKDSLADMVAEVKRPKKKPVKAKVEEARRKPASEPAKKPDTMIGEGDIGADVLLRPAAASESPRGRLPKVTGIRHWSTPDYTRIAIDLEEDVKYEVGRVPLPDRIFFDLHDTKLASELVGKTFEVGDGFLRKIRVAQFSADLTRVVFEVDEVAEYSAFLLPNPYRLIVDVHGKDGAVRSATASKPVDPPAAEIGKAEPARPPVKETPPEVKPAAETSIKAAQDATAPPKIEPAENKKPDATKELTEVAALNSSRMEKAKTTSEPTSAPTFEKVSPRKDKPKRTKKGPAIREAQPSSSGDRSLIRALGLKIGKIVVDAGHGGHDTGTIGPNGLAEKDLVLDVALRLGKLLETKLGAEVIYTRDDDTFIPLETRTATANQHQADLFISVHANSSHDPGARGVETYYLNFTSNAEALEVAARENAVSQKSVFELQDLVKKIALKEKIEESREFAQDVQRALHAGLSSKGSRVRDRGVKKAPFVVLIGANMPSILAEISFVSNPTDAKRLNTAPFRQKIADSLYRGVANYAAGLSGIKVAQGESKPVVAAQ